MYRITKRWTGDCFQLWCNPLWLTWPKHQLTNCVTNWLTNVAQGYCCAVIFLYYSVLLLHRGTVTLLRCVIVAVCYFCTAVLLLCLIIVLLYCCTVAYSIAGIQYYCCFITVRWYRCTLTYSIIAVLLLCGGIAARKSKGLFLGKVCLMFVHVLFVSYLRRD